MKKELIAPCGMNCAVCSAYLALKYDLKSIGIKRSYCEGCRPRGKKCAFIFKKCKLLMANKIQFCYECPDFPCKSLKHLDKRYQTFYRTSFIDNLELIKKKGITNFLKTQQKKWQCPKCGELICCHNGLCFNCDLDKLKDKKKHRYRWED
ncbi:MAG: DUF3795 domain-containing protein [bacterium]|nr:DUF3795 domain-containing protein [bacterium]